MHPQWNGMSTEEKLEQLKKVLGALEQAVGDRTMRLALDLDDALTRIKALEAQNAKPVCA